MFGKFCLLLLSLFILTGCANTNTVPNTAVDAKKDAPYEKTLDRVLISMSLDHSFFDEKEIAQSFSNRLSKRGITIKTIVLKPNPLDLEPGKNLKVAIWAFVPHQVFEISVIRSFISSMGSSFVLEGKLYETATNKQVWHFTYSGSGARLEADRFVDTVIQKLDADGLLPP